MQQYIGTKIIHAEPQEKGGADGYAVVYEDGYKSWSPKDAFENAYRESDAMTFGLAIEAIKKGIKVARKGWNGKDMWLELQVPDAHSKMSLPYIYIKTACDKKVPWLASQTDALAEDWYTVS